MSQAENGNDYAGQTVIPAASKFGNNKPGLENVAGIGGGGGDGMSGERLARLEAKMEAVETNIGNIHTDIRKLVGAGVGIGVILAGMIIGSYLLLATQMDSNRRELSELIRLEVGRIQTLLEGPSAPPS